jgi:hypothetical protein
MEDLDLLEEQASKHDITINTANADDVSVSAQWIGLFAVLTHSRAPQLPATKAILRGQAKRKEETGHRPILIHTSGTGVLSDVGLSFVHIGRRDASLTSGSCVNRKQQVVTLE